MNKAFTKTKELVLDENHKIIPDPDNGVILVCIGDPKINKKGELVENKTEYCYPRIAQALRKYADLILNDSVTVSALVKSLNRVYYIIDELDKTFKQF